MRDTYGPPKQLQDMPASRAAQEGMAFTPSRQGSAVAQRVNWWVRHTSSGWEQSYFGTLAQREQARRSRTFGK